MNILVYCDEGVGCSSFKVLMQSLEETFHETPYVLQTIDHYGFLEKGWEEKSTLLIFPGGRDVPYHAHLRGKANERIRRYVEEGGNYLGICAGAYYGAAQIEFEKGKKLEIIDSRELAFFPGTAYGPVYRKKGFSYQNESGSCIAKLAWQTSLLTRGPYSLYYKGGCAFVASKQHSHVTTLACYDDLPDTPAAIVRCQIGKGQAILCGVHPEFSYSALRLNNPHLRPLFPSLKKGENGRVLFWKNLLSLCIKNGSVR